MPQEAVIILVLAALFVGSFVAIRECANASLHGERIWWKKAVYLAQQRADYQEFSNQLEEQQQSRRRTNSAL